jgi:hypothetical protein
MNNPLYEYLVQVAMVKENGFVFEWNDVQIFSTVDNARSFISKQCNPNDYSIVVKY